MGWGDWGDVGWGDVGWGENKCLLLCLELVRVVICDIASQAVGTLNIKVDCSINLVLKTGYCVHHLTVETFKHCT